MTYQQVAAVVSSIYLNNELIPCAYFMFPDDPNNPAPAPPFLVYYYPSDNDVKADNKNYSFVRELIVELYTDNKDFAAEKAVEDALTAAGFVYSRDETYIESEKLYEVTYNMEVFING